MPLPSNLGPTTSRFQQLLLHVSTRRTGIVYVSTDRSIQSTQQCHLVAQADYSIYICRHNQQMSVRLRDNEMMAPSPHQGTTNYVCIDLKMSLSKLTSMSKTSKLCQVDHSTGLDGTRCLYHFMVTLGQKAVAKNQTNAPFEKLFLIYREKLMTSFFDLRFFEVLLFRSDV